MRNFHLSARGLRAAMLGVCLAGTAGLATTGLAWAQQGPPADAPAGRPQGQGRMHGMAMMMCGDANEMSLHFLQRFEKTVQPKPEQKADFEALKGAVAKADQIFKTACPSEAERADHTPAGRLARMEKTAQATVDAMKLVRPPFEALYAKLDDKQRDRLRWAQHEGHPEGWMQRMREGMHHPMQF